MIKGNRKLKERRQGVNQGTSINTPPEFNNAEILDKIKPYGTFKLQFDCNQGDS